MREKVIEAFKALGFVLDQLDDFGYAFQYEGKNYVLLCNDDDENFLNITMPGVIGMDDCKDSFYQIMDMFNNTLKYVKAYRIDNDMWLVYERAIIGEEDLQAVISHMILYLEVGFNKLYHMKDDTEEPSDTDEKTEE